MADEQWPPNSGVPPKKRFKKARKLRWGETPFDDLTRAELLRLVQAYHAATVAAHSVMAIRAEIEPGQYWEADGSGGRALGRAKYLLDLVGENDPDPASENIYRSFFRIAVGLLFPYLGEQDKFYKWGINDKGVMTAPFNPDEGYRALEWRDVLPVPNGEH